MKLSDETPFTSKYLYMNRKGYFKPKIPEVINGYYTVKGLWIYHYEKAKELWKKCCTYLKFGRK